MSYKLKQNQWISHPFQTLSETTDGVVALVHGGKEYSEGPTPKVRRYVSRAVASGAFLVIGNHPHVEQVRKKGYFDFFSYYEGLLN